MRSLCPKGWSTVVILLVAVVVLGCQAKQRPQAETPAREPAAPITEAEGLAGGKDEEVDPEAAARALGTATENPIIAKESGLRYIDIKEGEGNAAAAGQTAVVHYTGWLVNGRKFDSSVDRGQPFKFPLGAGRVIKGWDEGVAGMKVGGVRKLIVPPELGYGSRGAGGAIPPNATLIFEVELLGVR